MQAQNIKIPYDGVHLFWIPRLSQFNESEKEIHLPTRCVQLGSAPEKEEGTPHELPF